MKGGFDGWRHLWSAAATARTGARPPFPRSFPSNSRRIIASLGFFGGLMGGGGGGGGGCLSLPEAGNGRPEVIPSMPFNATKSIGTRSPSNYPVYSYTQLFPPPSSPSPRRFRPIDRVSMLIEMNATSNSSADFS